MPHPPRDRATVIDHGFAALALWSARLIVIALAAAMIGWIVAKVWVVLLPIMLAVLVSSLLAPMSTWLRGKGWPASLAAGAVVVGFIGLAVAVIAILTPQVAGQADAVAKGASDGLQRVRDWLTQGPLGLSEGQITRAITATQEKLQASATTIGSGVFSTIGAATGALVNLILVLMLTFLFLKDGDRFRPWVQGLGGAHAGQHLGEVLHRAWVTLGSFMRTQSIVAFVDAVIIGIGLVVIGVPLAIPLAVVTFIGAYVPVVGAVVSGALAVLVTLVTNSPTEALIVLGLVVVVQQLEGNVLSPWLQGRSMDLHAAVVLMAVTAGGALYGVSGAFLAVPLVAIVAEVLRYIDRQIDDATAGLPEPTETPPSDA